MFCHGCICSPVTSRHLAVTWFYVDVHFIVAVTPLGHHNYKILIIIIIAILIECVKLYVENIQCLISCINIGT